MNRRRIAGCAIATLLAAMIILPSACQDATQISLEVTTNVTWRDGLVTAFTVGGDTPTTTEGLAITAESFASWSNVEPRFVGSLTVIPKDSDSSVVSVKIVMGFAGDGDGRKCAPPLYQGCIVARRRLPFVLHQRLRLPIRMYAQCVDVPCDAFSTCNELRQCVASEVTCSGSDCDDPTTAANNPSPLVDGAASDSSSDGALDQEASSLPNDASKDALGSGSDAGAGVVECGLITCVSPGFYCCFFPPQPNNSQCMVASTEQQCVQQLGGIALRCDGAGDCPGTMNHCCTGSNTSACAQTCGPISTQELCHDTPMGCEGAKRCTGAFHGIYATCE
jgi:hypothetical protein